MNDIGADFKSTRLASSVSLEEAAEDTGIPESALEQIEEGTIGAFKDIFKLKEYLREYAKYLGLDQGKVIDEFNEYMFEYTSKIPIEDLERAIEDKKREEENLEEQKTAAISPYLNPQEKESKRGLLITIIVIIILVALTLIWAIKQVA